jgi:mono/diheme cytochrome c family protein
MSNRAPHLLAALVALTIVTRATAADPLSGAQIYAKQCVKCHGQNGEGSKEYPHALAGERSAASLAKLIARTMPDDDPGTCTGPDAEKVSQYVFDSFYSPAARAKNKLPRVDLARLTVGQYRNAIADVIGSFRPAGKWGDERGLKAEYFKNRRFGNADRQLTRTDPEIDFHFDTASPVPGKLEDYEFSIRWEGSVLAPETGDYEFIVYTEHAIRLWVNDPERPLIDAWVKSGTDIAYRGSIYLLAGRPYHLKLEFSKAKQGVDDSKNQKEKPRSTPASVALLWKRPGHAAVVIPSDNLSTSRSAAAFCISTPFPPDDRSLGWERGTSVSKAWDAAETDAALDTAGYVAAHLGELSGTGQPTRRRGQGSGNPASINLDGDKGEKPNPDREKKLRDFCTRFAERAFRRPLTDEQKKLFIEHQFEAVTDPEMAVKRVVVLVLKSPRFLYREVGNDGYDAASRLSFGLWDSIPDDELLKAATAGQLKTREQVKKQAERMLAEPRAKAKLRDFLHAWLKVDHPPDMAKDSKRYPGFDAAVMSDLRDSLDRFLDDAVWTDTGDFRRLLTSDEVFLNGRLGTFYGVNLDDDAGFEKVKLDPGKRAGILTHPYLMAAFAYTGSTSPIHRGVFIARGVLGLTMRPPPEAFTPLAETLHPTLTTRERVALQTRPAACVSCHGVINPLGFTLESFDAVGRFRDKDNGKAVDTSGSYQTRSGDMVKFAGVHDLAKYLADSEEVQTAFAQQLFHHLVKQPIRAYGANRPAELRKTFAATGFDVRKLMVEIMMTAAVPPPRL